MKLTNISIQKSFTVTHKGKTYYLDYLNSTGPICGLFNRFNWQVLDEELEELPIYKLQSTKARKLYLKLIRFCIKHFNDYKPNYKERYQ